MCPLTWFLVVLIAIHKAVTDSLDVNAPSNRNALWQGDEISILCVILLHGQHIGGGGRGGGGIQYMHSQYVV